jgi:hypothetical protein
MSWFSQPQTDANANAMRESRLTALARLNQTTPPPDPDRSAEFWARAAAQPQNNPIHGTTWAPQGSFISAVPAATIGTKVGNLTCLGTAWIDMSTIEWINLAPKDGCGAELFRSNGHTIHMNHEEKIIFVKWLYAEAAKVTKAATEVTQLEEIASK